MEGKEGEGQRRPLQDYTSFGLGNTAGPWSERRSGNIDNTNKPTTSAGKKKKKVEKSLVMTRTNVHLQ